MEGEDNMSTDIGTWFMTYNNEKMWSDNFGSGNPINYRALLSENPNVFGIQDSSKIEDIDFQIKKMAEIGIDFIIYDITNGGLSDEIAYGRGGNEWIVDNAILTSKRLALWNKNNSHKIRYCLAVGMYKAILGNKYDKDGNLIKEGMSIGVATEINAKAVFEKFYSDEEIGGDNYYCLDGKPLLIIHDWGENVCTVPHGWNNYKGDRTYGDKFTVRNGQMGEVGTYGWQTNHGTLIHSEVEAVCPGWTTAHGDSKIPRENGEYYRRNWQIILDNPLPKIVVIVALNDYNESLAIFPADTSNCNDKNEEQWRNTKGELDPFLYWNITKEYIAKIRNMQNNGKGDAF